MKCHKFDPVLELVRLEENFKYGTFGYLLIQKEIFCATLEPCDMENQRNISSIPAQQYRCIRFDSAKFGTTFKVDAVPGRSGILFHAGNFLGDTWGCILLGQYHSVLHGKRSVLNSGATFKRFMKYMEGHNVLHLTIKEVY